MQVDETDVGSIPGLGRSPGGGHGNPGQYSCLENPMGRGAWQTTVHRVTKRQTQLRRSSAHMVNEKVIFLTKIKHQNQHGKNQCVWSGNKVAPIWKENDSDQLGKTPSVSLSPFFRYCNRVTEISNLSNGKLLSQWSGSGPWVLNLYIIDASYCSAMKRKILKQESKKKKKVLMFNKKKTS